MPKEPISKKTKIGSIIGILSGFLIILTGILTALKITPQITAAGSEVLLGIWRIFAGLIILISSYLLKKHRILSTVIIFFGAFEILVFFVEKDYTVLVIAPFLAILSGILGIKKK